MIIEARYTDETQVPFNATFDDGREMSMPGYPSNTHYDKDVAAFLDGGGVFDDYDPNYGVTDEQLRWQAYRLNEEQADSHVEAAERTPDTLTTLDDVGLNKSLKRRNNRAKGKDKITDNDDVLADYIDSVIDVQGSADDIVENLARQALIDWDGSGVSYPIWTPPLG